MIDFRGPSEGTRREGRCLWGESGVLLNLDVARTTADCELSQGAEDRPAASKQEPSAMKEIGNWQLTIGNIHFGNLFSQRSDPESLRLRIF